MINVADLSVTLSDKPILENYSLSVGQGDVLAILGANGVGKTTLSIASSACADQAPAPQSSGATSATCRSCSTPPSRSPCSISC